MYHSFIYRRCRIEVDLRPRDDGWAWTYNLNSESTWSEEHFSAGPLQGALRASCDSARAQVDRQLSQAVTMNESPLGIRVERLSPKGPFVWVIVELRSPTETVELGASLNTYERPEEALLAGESVLGAPHSPTASTRLG